MCHPCLVCRLDIHRVSQLPVNIQALHNMHWVNVWQFYSRHLNSPTKIKNNTLNLQLNIQHDYKKHNVDQVK